MYIGVTAHFVLKKLFIHLLLGCYSYVKWEPHQGSHNMSLNFCTIEKIIIRRDYKQWLFFFQLTDKERLTWISEINIRIIYLLLFFTNFLPSLNRFICLFSPKIIWSGVGELVETNLAKLCNPFYFQMYDCQIHLPLFVKGHPWVRSLGNMLSAKGTSCRTIFTIFAMYGLALS